MRWKNGGGWTSEVAVQPGEGDDFAWRISIAEIETDGDFSRFPGVDRSILVLDGAGMILDVEGVGAVDLRTGGAALAFSGDVAVHCRLSAGPTRDFNVMTRRGAYVHTLERHALVEPLALSGACLVYVLSGSAQAGALVLAAGDSLRVEAGPVVLCGTAELVLARLLALGVEPG